MSLAHLDNELFKNLLALNDKLEELKLHRCKANEDEEERCTTSEAPDMPAGEEYDDDDIDEEVDDDSDDVFNVYSSLPPTQVLERAAAADHEDRNRTLQPPENNGASASSSGSGLDVMGGLKFMLRSRSFLLRPPFHKKNNVTSSGTTPRRSRIIDSPFR